ncbi:hypothetical protein KKP62_30570 [Rhodococcus sp. GOMB7]|uniref:hypothetical protein n=1 Tax=unclassified Rhodococcus (in: high G+C Gram-positive bacteria) TaxID=192944 RepID=UPI0015F532A3|nr:MULTISPECIES: hypothetical protein [unclassified Rhodococcus (in: high G+C Gram-positive bacteria)]MBT9299320.1 hypothetical protein [Rhodococcus sp. GOMB7]MCC4306303.1 hypothetical protein [Rhodococcus sp. 3-2]
MSFTAGAWLLHFANLAAEVDAATGFSLEHAVAKRLYAGIVDGQLRWARMKHEPQYFGYSGTEGTRYDTLGSRLGQPLRAAYRRIPFPRYI